jgi:hypothetical protein
MPNNGELLSPAFLPFTLPGTKTSAGTGPQRLGELDDGKR